jgi:hypothetical protein
VAAIKEETKTQDVINLTAVNEMRDPKYFANSTISQDISSAYKNLKPFLDAKKGDQEDLQKWRREKFDSMFAKYIHRYFISQKAKNRVTLEEAAYRDLHFMTNKYLELIGSVEFNTYMQQILNTKLGLNNNSNFQALLVDLLVNSIDLNSQGKTRAIALERIVFLVLQLDNPSFYL